MAVQDLTARNSIIKQMEERIASYVFDSSDTPWFVRFNLAKSSTDDDHVARLTKRGPGGGGGDDDSADFYPELFNCAEYRLSLRRFLESGRNLVRRFGFCAFYVLKANGIARWWKEYISGDASRRSALGLPMGIIFPDEALFTWDTPKGDAWLGPLRRRVHVHPLNANARDYDYHVYEYDTSFIATPESMWQANVGRGHHPARIELMQLGIGSGHRDSIIPSSEFYDLVDRLQHLQEARQNHLFAESQAAQTLIIVQTKPPNLKDTGAQHIPTSRLFEQDTILEERLRQVAEVRTFTLDQAQLHINSIQARINGHRGTSDDAPKLVQERRLALGRPSPVDEMIELSEEMQLAHVSRPTAIMHLDEIEASFRRAVASAMKLPYEMTEGSAASNGSLKDEARSFNGARSVESREEKELTATVMRERAFYSAFFEHVYAVTFGGIDMHELERAHDAYEQLLAELKQSKRLGEMLGRELAGMTDASQEAREEKARAAVAADDEASRTKTTRKHVRVSMRRVRELLDNMTRRGGGFARLVFQPGMTRDAINQLTGLLAIYDRGVLAAKTLEPFVQDVFGSDTTLREPLAPPTAAAGPSKKRKPQTQASGRPTKRARPSEDRQRRRRAARDNTATSGRHRKPAVQSTHGAKKKKADADNNNNNNNSSDDDDDDAM